MNIQIADFTSNAIVSNVEALQAFLDRRYADQINTFWLRPATSEFPQLGIFIKGNCASMMYYAQEGHPGYQSRGSVEGLHKDEFTTFYMSVEEEQPMSNESVVPLAEGLRAVIEFCSEQTLPQSIQWLDILTERLVS